MMWQFHSQHLSMTINTFARANHNPDHRYLDAMAATAEGKLREVRQ